MNTVFLQAAAAAGSVFFLVIGLRQISASLNHLYNPRLKNILLFFPSRAGFGILTGIIITLMLQSSSAAITVILGFVHSGMLDTMKAAGAIIGANIAVTLVVYAAVSAVTTLPVVLIALLIGSLSLPLLTVFRKNNLNISTLLSGMILFFLGLYFLEESLSFFNITGLREQLTLMPVPMQYILLFAAGVLLGTILQSSVVTVMVILLLVFRNHILPVSAAAAILGANLGSAFHSNVNSAELSNEGKTAARFHLLFNVTGLLWAVPFFSHFLSLCGRMSGNEVTMLVIFHAFFNIITAIIVFPFIRGQLTLAEKLVRSNILKTEKLNKISFSWDVNPEKFEIEFISILRELGMLSGKVHIMLLKTLQASDEDKDDSGKILKEIIKANDFLISQHEKIALRLNQTGVGVGVKKWAQRIFAAMQINNELAGISDNCLKLLKVIHATQKQHYNFHKKAFIEIEDYAGFVLDFMRYISDYLQGKIITFDFTLAEKMENNIDAHRDLLQERGSVKIEKGGDIRAELAYIDIVRKLEHIGDNCLNMAIECRRLF